MKARTALELAGSALISYVLINAFGYYFTKDYLDGYSDPEQRAAIILDGEPADYWTRIRDNYSLGYMIARKQALRECELEGVDLTLIREHIEERNRFD